MDNIEYIHYDEEVDHLTIYKSDEKISSNIDLGLAILSFSARKEIIGIEFMGAHENFKIPKEVLKTLQACKVEIRYNPIQKTVIISAVLQYPEKERPLIWSHAGVDLGINPISENFACSII